ncbi:M10 family metallopeptidase C-terminal domain-containing protein [Yersinia pekkanenii]|uniref:serralysin n=1 Tax=Yersinia pekkanenii TaxID=1288385 RepID=A0A0T9R7U0_9GAMM|nr:M10 family metallopeptidase C-terminal domain-containing protein [Yersinia pekkanenii]CNI49007.1 metalloprotease [Yersinia pekkanenii]CRY67004.1 metalloprotease [Yersinia pekkanenii]
MKNIQEFNNRIANIKYITINNSTGELDVFQPDLLPQIPVRSVWNKKTITYSVEKPLLSDYHIEYMHRKHDIYKLYEFNKNQSRLARRIFQSYADIIDIEFVEVKNGTSVDVQLLNYDKNDSYHGYGFSPHEELSSPIFINTFHSHNREPDKLNYGGKVLAHEIGHTLGLDHTHNLKIKNKLTPFSHKMSVMSYFSAKHSDANHDNNYPSTPQLLDIAILQYRYGANISTRTGNTTYGFNSNSDREHFTARNSNDKLIFCVWDAGGIDTLDFSRYDQNQMINLNQGSFSHVGGLVENVSIALNVTIENAISGSGNDTLLGNQEKNTLTGGEGNDQLYGGGGADHLWGGKGQDIFCYRDRNDSTLNAADTIYDFESGHDKIDLSYMNGGDVRLVDAITTTDNRRNGHTQVAQFYSDTSDLTYLMIDFDDTNKTDIVIKLVGKHQLATHDFICAPLLAA